MKVPKIVTSDLRSFLCSWWMWPSDWLICILFFFPVGGLMCYTLLGRTQQLPTFSFTHTSRCVLWSVFTIETQTYVYMQLMGTRWIVTTRCMTIIRGELERDLLEKEERCAKYLLPHDQVSTWRVSLMHWWKNLSGFSVRVWLQALLASHCSLVSVLWPQLCLTLSLSLLAES